VKVPETDTVDRGAAASSVRGQFPIPG
jgi:hypothetical protein